MAVSREEFKEAMACRASGVSIVTSRAGDTIHGMTVSDFVGVSLDPPMLLVCAEKTSITTGVIEQGRCFAVNILAKGQDGLSNRFASKKDEHRRFEGLVTESGVTGAPLIPGALSNLDCSLVASHDAGDHLIFIGAVERTIVRDLEPLIYSRGSYVELR